MPSAHILPHWNWAGREGEITPVHVYTSGDEAELFVNGKSQGRIRKNPKSRLDRYCLRWNDVVYQPGEGPEEKEAPEAAGSAEEIAARIAGDRKQFQADILALAREKKEEQDTADA